MRHAPCAMHHAPCTARCTPNMPHAVHIAYAHLGCFCDICFATYSLGSPRDSFCSFVTCKSLLCYTCSRFDQFPTAIDRNRPRIGQYLAVCVRYAMCVRCAARVCYAMHACYANSQPQPTGIVQELTNFRPASCRNRCGWECLGICRCEIGRKLA